MRPPRKHVQRQNQHVQAYHVCIDRCYAVSQIEHGRLPKAKPRNAQKRTERTPFSKKNKQYDKEKHAKAYQQPPRVFARQTNPKQSKRGRNPCAAFKVHGNGEDMPDNHEHAAKIAYKIGNENRRSRKYEIAIDKIPYQSGNTAFERIAKKGKHAHFQAEFTAHIHCSRVATAYFRNIALFESGNKQREIETTDKITYGCHNHKLPPVLR